MGQTTMVEEATMSKDAGNMANTGVLEQVPKQVPEQEALEQVTPEQGLLDLLTEKASPRDQSGHARADHSHHKLNARWSA
jgi:hypothetical protein